MSDVASSKSSPFFLQRHATILKTPSFFPGILLNLSQIDSDHLLGPYCFVKANFEVHYRPSPSGYFLCADVQSLPCLQILSRPSWQPFLAPTLIRPILHLRWNRAATRVSFKSTPAVIWLGFLVPAASSEIYVIGQGGIRCIKDINSER